MDQSQSLRRPLLVWPGVVAVVLQWILWLGVPLVVPDSMTLAIGGGIFSGGIAVLLWWTLLSRVPMVERVGALVLIPLVYWAVRPLLDVSIQGGMMGLMFGFVLVPTLCLSLVLWAQFCGGLGIVWRRVSLVAAVVAGGAVWLGMRTEGLMGEGRSQLAMRWAESREQKLLVMEKAQPVAAAVTPAVVEQKTAVVQAPARVGGSWPGFRGANRDDRVTGVRIRTDWKSSPPKELWRRAVGPAWSSMAVENGLIYTQEQRGEAEVVSCYDAATGKPVWTHKDAVRFYESNGGAGPRATPTVFGGRVYSFGGTGKVNALDAASGRVVWSADGAKDTGAETPDYGFSGSPLATEELVIVAASGKMVAYDRASGAVRWKVAGGWGYSSPQLMTLGGTVQVVMLDSAGVTAVAPADGAVLWRHAWHGTPMLQPAATGDGGLLVFTGDMSGGQGTRRLAVAQADGGWKATELWTSNGLKPYFNDVVVHDGHAYGFDGSILSCISLQDGKRQWKGGRYGHGQLVVLADQGLLLVLSEEGELVLVSASAGEFKEIARARALEGKTWNHLAMAGDVLLARNGEEMVAFQLSGK